MNLRNKRAVLVALAVAVFAAFLAGGVTAHFLGNKSICPNGKHWIERTSYPLEPVRYVCPGGVTVSK